VDPFVVKLDADGGFLRAEAWGGPDVDEHTPDIAEDTYLLKLLPNGYWE